MYEYKEYNCLKHQFNRDFRYVDTNNTNNRDYRWISSSPQQQKTYYRYSDKSMDYNDSYKLNESNRSISPIISPSTNRNIHYNDNKTPKKVVVPEKMLEDCIFYLVIR